MSRICGYCGKRPQVGNMVSHANNKVKKWVYPNVHMMRFTTAEKPNNVQRAAVCTKCVKARKVQKVI